MKKVFFALLLITLVISPIFASAGKESVAAPVEKATKLTIGIIADPNVEDYETNYLTKYIEEQTGVDLDFILLPYDKKECAQKVELMMLDGTGLPDILAVALDLSAAQIYGEMGMIIPLNDYVNNTPRLDKNLADMIASPITKETYLKYCTSSNGNIYGFGSCSMTPNNSVSKARIMVYGPWEDAWMAATGSKGIETTEDLKNFLLYVKNNDMNGNGDKTDEFALMGFNGESSRENMIYGLMNPFIYTQQNYYYNDNGTVKFSAVMDEWKDGLKYVKSLYDAGLFTSITFTQDQTSFKSILASDPTRVASIAWISPSALAATDARREEYRVVGALTGPTGLKQTCVRPNIPSSINLCITKNCKDVATAMEVLDVIMSEEFCIVDRYGIEGEHYQTLTGADVGTSMYASMGFPGDKLTTNAIYGTTNNVQWHGNAIIMNDGSTFTLREKDAETPGKYNHSRSIGAGIMKELDYENKENAIYGLIFTEEENEVIAEYKTGIEDTVYEMFAKFVTGEVDIDKGWDSYVKSLNAMGLQEYLAAVQSAWTRMSK